MKNFKPLIIGLLAGIGLSAWAQPFNTGTNDLANENLPAALINLSAAVTASPHDPGANIYLAFTRLLSIPTDSATSGFLTALGVSSTGRDIYKWKANLTTNSNGNKVFKSTFNVDMATGELRNDVLATMAAADINLANITDTTFTLYMPSSVTRPNKSTPGSSAGSVTLDYGDVQMLRATLEAEEFFIYTVNSWNANALVSALSANIASKEGIVGLATGFPNLLKLNSTSDYPAAEGVFTNAINNYLAASQFIRNRPDGTMRLFNLSSQDAAPEAAFRSDITQLENSLNGPVAFNGDANDMVSMSNYFNSPHAPRSFFPTLTNKDDFVWNSEPDPTLGGVVTGLTSTNLSRFFIKKFKFGAELVTPGESFTVLNSLNGNNLGQPNGVVQGSDGNLYGTMAFSGNSGNGAVFKLSPASATGSLSLLHQFGMETNPVGGSADGQNPNDLTDGASGTSTILGTTEAGGANGGGTVFVINTGSKLLTTLWNFPQAADGYSVVPGTGLLKGSDGNYYGSTVGGGPNGQGILFRISPSATTPNFQIIYAFGTSKDKNANSPNTLTEGADGNLYGTTLYGGGNNDGTIFEISPPGLFTNFTLLYEFGSVQDQSGDPLDGNGPNALVQGKDGILYGTTLFGGVNDTNYQGYFQNDQNYNLQLPFGTGDGTVFSITTNGLFTSLYSFDQSNFDGFTPIGALVQNTNGVFLGATTAGGANGRGTLFTYVPGAMPQFVTWLSKGIGGEPNPPDGLVAGTSPGNFFGTTGNGENGNGTIYHFTSSVGSSGVGLAPSIARTGEPAATIRVLQGQQVKISVTVATGASVGAGPFTYQWLSNSIPLSDGGNVVGSMSNILILNPAVTTDSGPYKVVVANASGSVTSTVCAVTVSADTLLPTVLIATPPALNARLISPVTYNGTASDNVQVASVNYWITNHSGYGPLAGQATLSAAKVASSNWTFTTSPYPGSNVLTVRSMDFSGNMSLPKTAGFFVKAPASLSLGTVGIGTVVGKALIIGDTAPANNAQLNIGEEYSLTATPATNWGFANWAGGGNFVPVGSTTGKTLNFIMEPGESINAVFTNLSFQYNGLFSVAGAGPTVDTAGIIENLLVKRSGVFSGALLMQGANYSLSGAFKPGGIAALSITRKVGAGGQLMLAMTNLNASDVWDATQLTISGTVTGTNNVVLAGVASAGWTSTFTLTLSALTDLLGSGAYTVVMPPPASQAPPGSGYMLVTNDEGTLLLTGALADGTAFSQTTWLGEDASFPVYASLYANNIGLLTGNLILAGGVGVIPPTGVLTWIKNPSTQTFYPAGISNAATVIGSPWVSTTPLNQTVLAASQLVVSGPGLALPLSNIVTVTGTNLMNGATVLGSVNPKTGQLKINVTTTLGKTTGLGAVTQDAGTGAGFYVGKTNAGAIQLLAPPLPIGPD